jgi:chromosome segregation ATPase
MAKGRNGGTDITVAILREIRDEIRGTNARLDQTNTRLDHTISRLDDTNVRLDRTNGRLDTLIDDFSEFRAEVSQRFDTVLAVAGKHHAELADRVRVLETRVDRLEPR